MSSSAFVRCVVFGLTALLLPGAFALGQSESDLRRENQRLTAEASDLRTELEAARDRIAELEAEIEQLRGTIAALRRGERPGGTPRDPLPQQPISIDGSDPAVSPRGLLTSLIESYEETMGDRHPLPEDERAMVSTQRQVREWIARVNRELRTPVSWNVRLLDVQTSPRGPVLQLQSIDPQHPETELGDPFFVLVPGRLTRTLDSYHQRGLLDGPLVLRGTLLPEVQFNPQRREEGPFNNPPLIGSWAELAYRVDMRSLLPVTEDREQAEREQQERQPQ